MGPPANPLWSRVPSHLGAGGNTAADQSSGNPPMICRSTCSPASRQRCSDSRSGSDRAGAPQPSDQTSSRVSLTAASIARRCCIGERRAKLSFSRTVDATLGHNWNDYGLEPATRKTVRGVRNEKKVSPEARNADCPSRIGHAARPAAKATVVDGVPELAPHVAALVSSATAAASPRAAQATCFNTRDQLQRPQVTRNLATLANQRAQFSRYRPARPAQEGVEPRRDNQKNHSDRN